ncbi:unnamed protein product [Lactuca saligna]|uniref:Uncharacterized protein n=1 Tax=Lactuca saligna TaxID=75948 RepID=A0AA36EBH9_LACSI|nr:unnamed protein product [Lactuca saligna]
MVRGWPCSPTPLHGAHVETGEVGKDSGGDVNGGATMVMSRAEFDGLLSMESRLRKSISEIHYLMLSTSLTGRDGGAGSGDARGGGGAGGGIDWSVASTVGLQVVGDSLGEAVL